jgi:DNA-binding transcriptional MocR family regulator
VAIEDPAFVGVRDLLAALGLVAVPVAIDDAGPIPKALSQALSSGVQAMIVTPRAQNPYGSALDPERIAELAPILVAHPKVLLCEDDHAGVVAGTPARTLVDAATRERWAVVRSFSKSLGPDLRVALLAADPETTARLEGRQLLGIRWVSHLLQRLAHKVWTDKAVQTDLRGAAKAYTQRRSALIDALAAEGIEAHGRSGLNVWIPVREEGRLIQAMLDRGWALSGGERFRLASGPGLRVCVATLSPIDAKALAADLSQVLQPARRSAGA